MDLKQLRNFTQICRLRSITAAAERIGIAQPALSRQIQSLEEEFGVPLLNRHGRGVAPTEQGEVLLERAERLLSEADAILQEVPGRGREMRGILTLGLPPAVAQVLALPLIAHFEREYPQVRLRIVSGFTGHVQEWLQRGVIDLGITYETGQLSHHRARPMLYERLYLISAPTGGAADSRPVSFDEAFAQPLILPTPVHGLRKLIEAAALQRDIVPQVTIEVDVVQVMLGLVEQGRGKTILSQISARDGLARGTLIARPIRNPELGRTIVLWQPEVARNRSLVNRFSEALIEQARQLVEDGTWRADWI